MKYMGDGGMTNESKNVGDAAAEAPKLNKTKLILGAPQEKTVGKNTLAEREVELDINSSDLDEKDRKLLEKYEKPKATMWSSSKEPRVPAKQTIFIFNGLASNPSQLVKEDESSMVHRIAAEMGADMNDVNIISISCPGFGGSAIRQDRFKNTREDIKLVSTDEYEALGRVWLKSAKLNKGNAVLIGHSAGGEVAVRFFKDGYHVLALDPALHAEESAIFERFTLANKVAHELTAERQWLIEKAPRIAKNLHEMAKRIADPVAKFLTDLFVGVSDGNDPQSRLHDEQRKKYQAAFDAKCAELVEYDSLLVLATRQDGSVPWERLQIFIAEGDILTPAAATKSWLLQSIRRIYFQESEDQIQQRFADMEVVTQILRGEDTAKIHHDSVFMNSDLAAKIAHEVYRSIQDRLREEISVKVEAKPEVVLAPPVEKKEEEIISPEQLIAEQTKERKLKIKMAQIETMECWRQLGEMLKGHFVEGEYYSSGDGHMMPAWKLTLSEKEKKEYLDLFLAQPALRMWESAKKHFTEREYDLTPNIHQLEYVYERRGRGSRNMLSHQITEELREGAEMVEVLPAFRNKFVLALAGRPDLLEKLKGGKVQEKTEFAFEQLQDLVYFIGYSYFMNVPFDLPKYFFDFSNINAYLEVYGLFIQAMQEDLSQTIGKAQETHG